jgi:peptide/nickel transport system permease protein
MLRMLAIRVVWALISIWAVGTFVFFAIRSTGDPTLAYLPLDYSPAQKAAVAHEIGTDRPLPVQYVLYLKRTLQGDFGKSHAYKTSALELIGRRLPNTLKLAAVAFLLSVATALPLGVISGTRPGTPVDFGIRLLATVGQAAPNFIVGILLMWIFAVKYQWLPVGGPGGVSHYVLPSITLAWFSISAQTRVARSAIMVAMRQDYIRTARAKGLSPRSVILSHATRNAMIPILTMIGLSLPAFIGGTVVIEQVFSWPGVGSLLLEAANRRDYSILQAAAIILSLFYIVASFLTDLSYSIVDPRIRAL